MNSRKPYEPPRVVNLGDAARNLAAALRALAAHPAAPHVMRGLEQALPESSAAVRAVLEDPGAALGALLAPMVDDARAELDDSDRTIARGLARAFGRGVVRGAARGPRK